MNKPKLPAESVRDVDFSFQKMNRTDFEECEFVNCVFTDLSRLSFIDCHFKNCNLSNSKTVDTALKSCKFSGCKLLGMNFSASKDFIFEVHFEDCLMDYVSFDRKKLNKSSFTRCKLHGANFTEADLSKSTLVNCDLYDALFSGTNLSSVDLTSAINFIIDPELNNIKKAKFTLQGLPGLLQRHHILLD